MSSSTRISSERGRLSSVKERIFCSTSSSKTRNSSFTKPGTSRPLPSFTVTVSTTIFDSTLIFWRNSRVCLDSCERPAKQKRFVIKKVAMLRFQAIYSRGFNLTVNETPRKVTGLCLINAELEKVGSGTLHGSPAEGRRGDWQEEPKSAGMTLRKLGARSQRYTTGITLHE